MSVNTKKISWIIGKNSSGKTQLGKGLMGCSLLPKSTFYSETPRKGIGVRIDFQFYYNRVSVFITGDLNIKKMQTILTELKKITTLYNKSKTKYDKNYKKSININCWNKRLRNLHNVLSNLTSKLLNSSNEFSEKMNKLYYGYQRKK